MSNRAPGYKTIVGTIDTKYANEVVDIFASLLIYAEDYARSIKLPDTLYEDSTIAINRQILKDCPPNAIFLSFGDNDYYPLLYLQQHNGYRQDVYIVNYYQLYTSQYIYMATQPRFKSSPIKLSVDSTLYIKEHNNYLRIKQTNKNISFDTVIETIRKGIKNHNNEIEIQDNRFILPMRIQSGATNSIKTDSTLAINMNARLTIDHKVLYRNEWILLDIIYNLGDRSLCALNGFDSPLKDLNDFFTSRGKVNVLKTSFSSD